MRGHFRGGARISRSGMTAERGKQRGTHEFEEEGGSAEVTVVATGAGGDSGHGRAGKGREGKGAEIGRAHV